MNCKDYLVELHFGYLFHAIYHLKLYSKLALSKDILMKMNQHYKIYCHDRITFHISSTKWYWWTDELMNWWTVLLLLLLLFPLLLLLFPILKSIIPAVAVVIIVIFNLDLLITKKVTMERERRESYRKCHLIHCEHVNHDDTKIKMKHETWVTRKGWLTLSQGTILKKSFILFSRGNKFHGKWKNVTLTLPRISQRGRQ